MSNNPKYGEMLLKYCGKWVALSHDESKIIASGSTLSETIENTKKTKEKKPIYVMVADNIGVFSY